MRRGWGVEAHDRTLNWFRGSGARGCWVVGSFADSGVGGFDGLRRAAPDIRRTVGVEIYFGGDGGYAPERGDRLLLAVVDTAAFAASSEGLARWREDLGVNVVGSAKVSSTDTMRSIAGNLLSAMLATAFNGRAMAGERRRRLTC